jgi:phosphopantetheinyl transferase
MAIIFQKEIDANTRLGIWKIEEEESFFKQKVPLHRHVTHPHKRLQHLAGRFLLQYLFPGFPYHLIQIADTRKPFLPDEEYHFSISHCGNYAAAIVSAESRVGIDIEILDEKVKRISQKFISEQEMEILQPLSLEDFTQIWSAKEAVFKWYGLGQVDFRQHIRLLSYTNNTFKCEFKKEPINFPVFTQLFDELCLCYVTSSVQ